MAFDFTGKTILITGANRGLGRELSKAVSGAGGTVYALGRRTDELESLAQECERIYPIIADLSNWEETRNVVDTLEALDGVVNNAATSNPWTPALDVPKDMVERTLNVNVLAAINIIQSTGKKMVAAGIHGSIINMSSILGVSPVPNALAYDVSKAALDMVTKQFALELGPHQIRVNSLNPTVFMTDMGAENWSEPSKASRFKSLTPMGRYANIDEIVGPILYLLSDYSSMVNGTTNLVDGGLLSNISV